MAFWNQSRKTLKVFTRMWHYLRLSEKAGADFSALKKAYTDELIQLLNLRILRKNTAPEVQGPAIYVCNHISYLDIPLLLNLVPELCFVSKSEVGSWPVIGKAARRIDTVFVRRDCAHSRENVRRAIGEALLGERKKIVIFPSATTSLHQAERWRKGPFEIARECGVPVVPLRLDYRPARTLAYIDDDNFLAHLYRLMGRQDLQVELEFGSPFFVEDPVVDAERVKNWCEGSHQIRVLADPGPADKQRHIG